MEAENCAELAGIIEHKAQALLGYIRAVQGSDTVQGMAREVCELLKELRENLDDLDV